MSIFCSGVNFKYGIFINGKDGYVKCIIFEVKDENVFFIGNVFI